MLNAYSIKKILPRLVIAAIAINLSYYFMVIAIDITNLIGDGIADLITLPFRYADPPMESWDPGDLSKIIISVAGALIAFKAIRGLFNSASLARGAGQQGGTTTGARAALSNAFDGFSAFLLSIALPIFLIIVAILIVLTIRLGLIVGLAISAPVAFAAMILPSTEGIFKKWWKLFTTTLMIYPIVMTLFALGRVGTYIFGNIDGQTIGGLTGVLAVVAQFIPLALIPFAFKLAGGTIGAIGNFIDGKRSGVKSFIQGDERDPNSRISRARLKADEGSIKRRQAGYSGLRNWTSNPNRGTFGRFAGRKAMKSVGGYNLAAEESAMNKRLGDELDAQIATGNDDEIRALTARRVQTEDGEKWLTAAGKEVQYADVMAARKRWGNSRSSQQKALTYEMSKASSPEEASMVGAAFDGSDGNGSLARDWKLTDRDAASMWTGSAYANQNNRLEWKYMKWDKNTNGLGFDSAAFASEVYEKRGSYQMSQMGSTTINALRQEHRAATDAYDTAQANQAAALAYGSTAQQETARAELEQASERIHRITSIADTFAMNAQRGGQLREGDDGQLIPAGNGAGHVNDEIAAFVNEVRPNTNARLGINPTGPAPNVRADTGPMTGPTQQPRDPGTGTVRNARRGMTPQNRRAPHREDTLY